MNKKSLHVLLASPRGFCAGVDRAIHIVEKALEKSGPPVYVRHEIVHNRFVVKNLEAKGAIFVTELDEVPDGFPVVFSAHGVPKDVEREAERRGLDYLDATCPLVFKVHHEAIRHSQNGYQIIMIGHSGHPEVIGTMGQVPPENILLIETAEQAETVQPRTPERLAYITQTTLSVDDAENVIAVLRRRFPLIVSPSKKDICFATTNRQQAVRAIAPRCDLILVVGAPNSSNSKRLVEVAQRSGCARSSLIQHAAEIDWASLETARTIGLTAGASAPEVLIDEVLFMLRERFDVTVEEIRTSIETVTFKLPSSLAG